MNHQTARIGSSPRGTSVAAATSCMTGRGRLVPVRGSDRHVVHVLHERRVAGDVGEVVLVAHRELLELLGAVVEQLPRLTLPVPLLLAWRHDGLGWTALVAFAVSYGPGTAAVVQTWLPADRLRPAPPAR